MYQLGKGDLPQLLQSLNAKLGGDVYPPFNVHGYLLGEEVMREEGRTADNSDRQHWWPNFRVVMLQEGLPSDSRCPMRAVWAEDAEAGAAFLAHPAFRISEFWLGALSEAPTPLITSLRFRIVIWDPK
ncbi:hypothetical protein KFL_001020010 [Klebsormidium nitens]|uniref:Uncharacterized protein n=1 Tax=Klebsormidium nitens TaxID=105231 RepID=A0A1Y1HU45_KLENI|nr:hypothetical protein KFL_001020010 [Klebsormidium nitens]|eukprot:GAQ82150.1 hypothetical protein KFL_001020010 [Klebsormidium nitens]